jgi:hypothetical protein
VNSRIFGSNAATLRREDPRQQLPVDVVYRRVLEDQSARRDFHARLDDLEHRTARGAERLVVVQRGVDVVVPAERVEAMPLVEIERGIVADPAKHRIRIGVEFDLVGVVIDVVTGADRHRFSVSAPERVRAVCTLCLKERAFRMSDIGLQPARALAEAIKRRDLSSRELLEHYLTRVEALNPRRRPSSRSSRRGATPGDLRQNYALPDTAGDVADCAPRRARCPDNERGA